MSISNPGRITRRGPAAERDRLITPPRRLIDKLAPFSFADRDLGVRPQDVEIFQLVAADTDTIILLRHTNPKSLAYIGVQGYTPKPIDCKAKTAKADDLVDNYAVDCAGLVVDPRLLSSKLFGDKLDSALASWQHFMRDQHREKLKDRVEVFLRTKGKGFYAVDTHPPSAVYRHYGCLMLSLQDVPRDFDPAAGHTRVWMQRHMAYLHGDYDLYGVVDVVAIDRAKGIQKQAVMEEKLFGINNRYTECSKKVSDYLNGILGCDMVQHGEQVAFQFAADKAIYVFAPNGARWVIRLGLAEAEMPGMMMDLFHYVFGTDLDNGR